MDIKANRLVKGAQGNAGTEYNGSPWFVRAGSWQYGAETTPGAIDAEKREQDMKYGVPYADVLGNPASSNPTDGPLPNPHNFSSNPGFMSSSTGDMATIGGPANGGTARIATSGSGRSLRRRGAGSTGAVNPPTTTDFGTAQDGGPQIVTSGFSG